MRRALILLVVPLVLGSGLAPSAEAQLPPATHLVTGRLDNPWGDKPVPAGLTVKLRKVTAGNTVGAVVDTDRTNRKGKFVLHAGASGQYVVQVKGAEGFLGGYVGGSPRTAASTKATAQRVGSTAALGKIWADPSFIQAKAVDTQTLAPINKVQVTVYANDLTTVLGTDVTGAGGRFKVTGLRCRQLCALYVSGVDTIHETGYVACDKNVVPTWGEACSSALGRIGRVYLEPIESP